MTQRRKDLVRPCGAPASEVFFLAREIGGSGESRATEARAKSFKAKTVTNTVTNQRQIP